MAQHDLPTELPPLLDAKATAIGESVEVTLFVSDGDHCQHAVQILASLEAAGNLHARLEIALRFARNNARKG